MLMYCVFEYSNVRKRVNIIDILYGQSLFNTVFFFYLFKNTILIQGPYNKYSFLWAKGSGWILMKNFKQISYALFVTLYTPDVSRNSRLCCKGSNVFYADILLNKKPQQFRSLILKLKFTIVKRIEKSKISR